MNRLVLLLLALTCSTSWAQTEDAREFSQEQLALFETKIRPVLVENCLTCHSNDDKQKGGLSLTSCAGLLRGGESGPAIVPGKPDASLLLEALRYESYEMPPKGKLSDRIIDDFATWIAMGAPDPRVESAPAKKAEHAIDAPRLWSLQPLSVIEPPQVDGVSDPIDRFIRGRLRREGLQPADPAPARVLLRRLYLDLTGLPPTAEEVGAFEQHPDFEAVVGRLLDSPEFGERWTRHWLDLTGYADTIGFPARAKRVIFLFMQGGPSPMESFDYKPQLNADHGKLAPFQREAKVEQPGVGTMRLFGSSWKFKQYGESGTWVSELFPHIGGVIDEVAVLNGMHTDNLAHAPACMQIHTGATNFVRPSAGAWVLYGLGTANQNLQGFITINPQLSGDGGSPQHFGSAPTHCSSSTRESSSKPAFCRMSLDGWPRTVRRTIGCGRWRIVSGRLANCRHGSTSTSSFIARCWSRVV